MLAWRLHLNFYFSSVQRSKVLHSQHLSTLDCKTIAQIASHKGTQPCMDGWMRLMCILNLSFNLEKLKN